MRRGLLLFGFLIAAQGTTPFQGTALAQEENAPGLSPITVHPSGIEAETTGSSRVDALLERRLRDDQFRAICRGCARGEARRSGEMFYPLDMLGEARMR